MTKIITLISVINFNSNIFSTDNSDPFSVGNGFLDKLLSGLSKIFDIIWQIIGSIVNAIEMLYKSLINITAWIDNLIDGIISGNIDNLPVLEAIGTYRYLVGDLIFYLTYMLIVTGCLFTIYKLVILIYSEITKMRSSMLFGGILTKMP